MRQPSFVCAEKVFVAMYWGSGVGGREEGNFLSRVKLVISGLKVVFVNRKLWDSDHAEEVAPRECGGWDRGRMRFGEESGMAPVEEAGRGSDWDRSESGTRLIDVSHAIMGRWSGKRVGNGMEWWVENKTKGGNVGKMARGEEQTTHLDLDILRKYRLGPHRRMRRSQT